MTTEFTHLPRHLRKWGIKVEEKEGWRFRGRPYTFSPRAVICHHTASRATSGNFASEEVVTFGRSDLPGPLCQLLLGRDGTVKIIAGGYANHAGYGGPHAGIPENTGNTYAWGIEAENNGLGERWTKEQVNAYYRLCAALLDLMNTNDVSKVFGHKEWTTRKIDPAGLDMNTFRSRVKDALNHGPSVVTVKLSNLQPGDKNEDVLVVKRRLKRRGFLKGSVNDRFDEDFKDSYAKWQKHLGYTGADANGIPGRTSLKKLGFRVVA